MAEARTAAGKATTFAEKSAIKDKLKGAYAISKFATGSMGKFDAKMADEPKVKAKGKGKKRGQVTGNMAGEKAKQLSMLSKLNSGPTTIRTASGCDNVDIFFLFLFLDHYRAFLSSASPRRVMCSNTWCPCASGACNLMLRPTHACLQAHDGGR